MATKGLDRRSGGRGGKKPLRSGGRQITTAGTTGKWMRSTWMSGSKGTDVLASYPFGAAGELQTLSTARFVNVSCLFSKRCTVAAPPPAPFNLPARRLWIVLGFTEAPNSCRYKLSRLSELHRDVSITDTTYLTVVGSSMSVPESVPFDQRPRNMARSSTTSHPDSA